MFSAVSANGFLSFFPPTVTLCLIRVIAEVSHFPGGVALHPETEMPVNSNSAHSAFLMTWLIDDVNGEHHGAVACATEVRAFPSEGPVGERVQFYVRSRALFCLGPHAKILDRQAVVGVFRVQDEHHLFASFNGDLVWFKRELAGGNFNHSRRVGFCGRVRKGKKS